jgi:hypothetical protein
MAALVESRAFSSTVNSDNMQSEDREILKEIRMLMWSILLWESLSPS